MIKEIQYTNIRRVLDNIMEHPLLRNVTIEQAVRYTIRFICLHGYPKMFQDKIENVNIKDFRGLLPCDLISIIQVKDASTGICLRAMTDTFTKGLEPKPEHSEPRHPDLMNNAAEQLHRKHHDIHDTYIPPLHRYDEEPSFKTQGRIIFTSFPEGCVEIAYKSIPVDEDGFPLLIDNENYLAALEAYIKLQVFTIKFDIGKLNANILQNAQQDYAFRAAELNEEFQQPSYSEAEALTRWYNTLIPSVQHFDTGFKNMSDREYIRRH